MGGRTVLAVPKLLKTIAGRGGWHLLRPRLKDHPRRIRVDEIKSEWERLKAEWDALEEDELPGWEEVLRTLRQEGTVKGAKGHELSLVKRRVRPSINWRQYVPPRTVKTVLDQNPTTSVRYLQIS